jgi:hypothetical protein
MKNKIIYLFVLIILLASCEKKVRRYNIKDILITKYPALTDSLTITDLIYNNDKISSWEFYVTNRFSDISDYERNEKKNSFFYAEFWRLNREAMPFSDSITYRVVDTLVLKPNYGILIIKNFEYSYRKKDITLYLSLYSKKKKLLATYALAQEIETQPGTNYSHEVTHSAITNKNRLFIYELKTSLPDIGKRYNDSIFTIYDLNTQKLIKSDTIHLK